MIKRYFYTLIIVSLLSMACKRVSEPKKVIQGEAQGTYYAISYYGSYNATLLQRQIDSLLSAFDNSLSTYVPNSLISRLNRNDSTVLLDQWLKDNILLSQEVSEATDGLFDISIGPIAAYWGFGHLPPPSSVSKDTIDSLLQYVGYKKMRIEGDRLIKEVPQLQLNCNAIAQGYAVDVVADFLLQKGIDSFLIDIGGEIYAKATKRDGSLWTVGIEQPQQGNEERIYNTSIHMKDEAIATSGNYRKFYEIEGETYVHSINPKTGYPVRTNVLSATVIAPTAAKADAYATACMILGVEKALYLVSLKPELKVFMMYNDGEKIAAAYSDSFEKYLE